MAGTELPHGPVVNSRLVVAGGLLTTLGAVISLIGTSIVAGAVVAAVRQWARSEERRELMVKAKAAANAAASSWRQEGGRHITLLPDAAAPTGVGVPHP